MESMTPLRDEVHVWYTPVEEDDSPNAVDSYLPLLCGDEMRRYERFLFEKDRRHFAVARALLRTGLSRYVDVSPDAWRFVTNRYGRPEISSPCGIPAIRFSLSHTGGMVACGFTLTRDLGVDVEDMQRRGKLVEVADHFFSEREVAELHTVPQAEQRSRFFDYWTLKESYIKARGMGLSIPLRKFSFDVGRHGVEIHLDDDVPDDATQWQFAQFDPQPRHRIAVAVRRRACADLTIEIRKLIPTVG